MRLPWIAGLTVAFVLLLSSRTSVANSTPPEELKRFVPFVANKVEASSFINVPINCPSHQIKIGPRCRTTF
ncbi:uncharacterized protein LOC143151578 [Ptiloglossa arizonensis]|uniref:uncharacterized protein LOC143151578 n=1 Tax=Ptiloglossa arizonensis TaxID=3350558 RepID=UPI003F9EE1DE